METTTLRDERLLRIHDVVARCGFSKATIYDQIRAGRFPRPVKIHLGGKSTYSVRWRVSEVQAWIARQIDTRIAPDMRCK